VSAEAGFKSKWTAAADSSFRQYFEWEVNMKMINIGSLKESIHYPGLCMDRLRENIKSNIARIISYA
jgi:hypothetical protein